jgi:hypothetical protein
VSEVLPLPVYPRKPVGDDLRLLKEAKARLGVDTKIVPVDAVIGSPGRVLSFREKLPWLQDYALVANPTIESVEAALKYVMGLNDDPRAMTVVKQLEQVFGKGVKEITDNASIS